MGKIIYENIPREYYQPYIGSEDDFQIAAAVLLDSLGLTWFHAANERKASPAAGRKLKLKGVKAGVPDIIILRNGILHAIELKVYPNKQSDFQTEWQEKIVRDGGTYSLVYSLDELLQLLNEFGVTQSTRPRKPYLADYLKARRRTKKTIEK
jgi:hypothetical protein